MKCCRQIVVREQRTRTSEEKNRDYSSSPGTAKKKRRYLTAIIDGKNNILPIVEAQQLSEIN